MNATADEPTVPEQGKPRGLTHVALYRFAHRPLALAALLVALAIFTAGALAPQIAPQGWNMINLAPNAVHHAPTLAHPFGTDPIGRDMLVRTLYGVRTTEEIALSAAALAALVGVLASALAGYLGGWVDAIVMRLADLVTALPAVVLTLAVIVYLGVIQPHQLILAYSAFMWAPVARVVRAHIVALRALEYVEAARALGASNTRILFRHLLPNAIGTILVAATSLVGQIVLIDATAEFFNYGLSSSVAPSLGNLVSDVIQTKFVTTATLVVPGSGSWWIWIPPSLVLALILVSINLVGDALDAAFNPSLAPV
jgi:ABC-type dipeptide/oligopeptide/nickel transport system permease subunit